MLAPPLFAVLATWLTPLWLVCVGVALGLGAWGLIYGLLALVRPQSAAAMAATVREGLLTPAFYLGLLLCGVAVAGTLVVPYRALFGAAGRLGQVGQVSWQVAVPKLSSRFEIPLRFPASELQSFELESDRPVKVSTFVNFGAGEEGLFDVRPGKVESWNKGGPLDKPFRTRVTQWQAANLGEQPATLTIRARTGLEYPEIYSVLYTALAVVAGFAVYLAVRGLLPKVAAIASTTAREAALQPLYLILMLLGLAALWLFIYLPYNTFGEDIKLLKESGVTLVMLLAIFASLWTAGASIADEIEGHTAITLLSKPIRRWEFVVGKFVGTLAPAVLMFLLLGFVLLVTVSFKVVYDARETGNPEPLWQVCYYEMVSVLPGLVLALFETVVFTAIGVALSTRLPLIPNLVICLSIYALGHLTPLIVQSSIGQFEIVRFVGQLIATILPVLDHFKVPAGFERSAAVPLDYLLMAGLYCGLYSAVALLLGLFLFDDRDLA